MRKVDKSSLVSIESFEGGAAHKRFLSEAMKMRVKILGKLNREEAGRVAIQAGGESVECEIDKSTDWVISLKPFPKFEIYYFLQRGEPEFEDQLLTLYSKEGLQIEIPAEDVADFSILYANVLIYMARRIGKDLPQISRYL